MLCSDPEIFIIDVNNDNRNDIWLKECSGNGYPDYRPGGKFIYTGLPESWSPASLSFFNAALVSGRLLIYAITLIVIGGLMFTVSMMLKKVKR